MKKKKRKLLQRITGTQKRAAIFSAACVIVLIVVIALIARLLSSDNPEQPENDSSSAAETEPGIIQEAGFFEESAYPVRFSLDGGSLRAELDGSASPDLKWEIRCEPETIFSIERDGEETDGKLSFLITPLMPGYVNLICEKNMQIGEQSYPLITIRADIIASVNQQRALEPELVDVKQIPSVFGASDTAYPYLISGSRIIFPNGGDWVVTPDESAGGYYRILVGTDSDSIPYAQVQILTDILIEKDEKERANVLKAGLMLESESLGIRQAINVTYNENGQMELTAAEGS